MGKLSKIAGMITGRFEQEAKRVINERKRLAADDFDRGKKEGYHKYLRSLQKKMCKRINKPDFYSIEDFEADVTFLDGEGADLNFVVYENTEATLIEYALSRQSYSVVERILSYGADPNQSGNDERTLLIAALDSDSVDFVKLLLSYGADPNQSGNNGVIPLIMALKWKHEKYTYGEHSAMGPQKFPESYPEERLISSLEKREKNALELIKYGADVNERAVTGLTPLMVAADVYQPKVIEAMLGAAAAIFEEDKEGDTALRHALHASEGTPVLEMRKKQCIDILKERGNRTFLVKVNLKT